MLYKLLLFVRLFCPNGNTNGACRFHLLGKHLYTMDVKEKEELEAEGWNYEGIAFNSAYNTEAVQHRLHNPNATVGAYHSTFSEEEKQNLIDAGWEYQGIGWYSCFK